MDWSQTSWNRLHEIVCWVVCSDYSVAYVCPPAGPWRTWLLSGFVLLLIPQMIFCKVGATVWRENFFKAPAAVTFLHLTPLCYVLVWSKPTSTAGTGSIWLHLPYSSSNPPALSRNSFWVCQRLERRGRCVLDPRAQSHRRPRSVVFLMCGNKKSITMENKRSIYPLWVTEDVWVTDEIALDFLIVSGSSWGPCTCQSLHWSAGTLSQMSSLVLVSFSSSGDSVTPQAMEMERARRVESWASLDTFGEKGNPAKANKKKERELWWRDNGSITYGSISCTLPGRHIHVSTCSLPGLLFRGSETCLFQTVKGEMWLGDSLSLSSTGARKGDGAGEMPTSVCEQASANCATVYFRLGAWCELIGLSWQCRVSSQ